MSRREQFPYTQLFNTIPIGLYRRTPEGKLIDVNPALVQASGWPDRDSLLALDDVKALYANPEDVPRLREAMARDGVVELPGKKKCQEILTLSAVSASLATTSWYPARFIRS